MFLVTAEEMREIDRRTIEEIGIPSIVLMENAGSQVARKIKEVIGNQSAKIVILAGHGNNGGDGFVTARHLGNNGYQVQTWIIGDIKKCSKESITHFHALVHTGYKVKFRNPHDDTELKSQLESADVIVDALLGTGVVGGLRDPIQELVEFVNRTKALKVAIDMPTGVNSDTGQVVNSAFKAAMTITFGYPKIGQLLYPGADYVGELSVADISLPPVIADKLSIKTHLLTSEMVQTLLPHRKADSHKGTYGHALILGGSRNMPGAPAMAAMAALRTGSGLTSLAVPESVQQMVFGLVPEALCLGLSETSAGYFSLKSLDYLLQNKEKYTAAGIGPGIGVWEEGVEWLKSILTSFTNPLVLDADALNLLAQEPDLLMNRKAPVIITPHPGEMARLIKKDTQYVAENRVDIAKNFAGKYEVYVVLKGAHTVIATPNAEIFINSTGGPELAKGGTGDVLTGMITGFLAQKMRITDALQSAVYLHGLSGTLASSPSNYSTVATDIIGKIGFAIHKTMSNHANPF